MLRETGAAEERIDWLAGIGLLARAPDGTFRPADVFRVRMVEALLDAGYRESDVESAAGHGRLDLSHLDRFGFLGTATHSSRSFADFAGTVAGGVDGLAAVYEVLGLPTPDPAVGVTDEEEDLLSQFMRTWGVANDHETLVRAARLVGDGTRTAAAGWPDLFEEQVATPARARLARGEVGQFPPEIVEAGVAMVALLPRLITWLVERYVEQRIVAGIVENFEEVLAVDGRAAPVEHAAERAVVFADVSGYTQVTEEHGDEAAVRISAELQRRAEAVALRNGGRLVKLLGDGAMLYFRDPAAGVDACLELVEALDSELGVAAHAGINAGPVIERDRDIFGRTVNLAARIAGTAGPHEVIASAAVVDAVEGAGIRFVASGEAKLKGVAEPISLYRVVARRSP